MSSMYKMKPIHDDKEKIDLPKCMYKAPFLYKDMNGSCGGNPNGHNSVADDVLSSYKSAIEDINKRQEQLSQRLKQLESKYSSKPCVGQKNTLCFSKPAMESPKKANVISALKCHDICIHYDVDYKPTAIVLLLDLLEKAGFKLSVNVHLSSTVLSKNEDELNDWNTLKARSTSRHSTLGRSESDLNFTLIASSNDGKVMPYLVLNPISGSTIYGSVNIMRYLARIAGKMNPSLKTLYPESEQGNTRVFEIDTLLDQIDTFSVHDSQFVEKFMKTVKPICTAKKLFFDKLTVVDLVVYEIGKQLKDTVNGELLSWFQFIESANP